MKEYDIGDKLKQSIPKLLAMADEMCTNNISRNCMFILTEIKDSNDNFFKQRQANIKTNNKKTPVTFDEILLQLKNIYAHIYDLNIEVYNANKNTTIIDIRYYPKSSLDESFRTSVINNLPMLHCKIATPPWLENKNKKFNINWQHQTILYRLCMFIARMKLKLNP